MATATTSSPSFLTSSPSLPFTTTPSPTATSDSASNVSIVTWVFFGLFLFLILVSRYLAKLVIALTKGFPLADQLKFAIKRDLEWPLFLTFVCLFLYLSLIVFFPFSQAWIKTALFWIVRLIAWFVIFIACVRVTRFLLVFIEVVMNNRGVERYIRRGVIEFLGIVRVILLCFVFLILIISYAGSVDDIRKTLSIFGSVNVITATLVVMFAPIIRALTGGLTILTDRFVKSGQAIELKGVAALGRVMAVQLRETKIKSFIDGSILHIPNILFLRYATVNGTLRGKEHIGDSKTETDPQKNTKLSKFGTTKVTVRFPVSYDTDLTTLRTLVLTQVPSETSVVLDDDLVLKFQRNDVTLAEVDMERTKLMLDMMELMHKNKIEVRF